MSYELNIPVTGFTEFYTWKRMDDLLNDHEVEIIIEQDVFVIPTIVRLRGWLRQIGVPAAFIDKFVDMIWTWPLLHYDLSSHHLTIPKRQLHPITPEPMEVDTFLNDGPVRSDPFDPFPKKH